MLAGYRERYWLQLLPIAVVSGACCSCSCSLCVVCDLLLLRMLVIDVAVRVGGGCD